MNTKNIIFVLFLFFIIGKGQSQSTINNLNLLKSELDTLSAKKMPIVSVALNQAGDWIVLYGDIGYSFIRMPKKLSETLDTLNKKESLLKDIDFSGKSGWVLSVQENAFFSDSVQGKLLSNLKKINQQGKSLVSIDTYKDKSIAVFDRNYFYHEKAPASLKKKLSELQYRNQIVKNIALTKNDGWLVLYSAKGFAYYNIPLATAQKIKQLIQNGSYINKVFFLNDKWIVVYDDYKYVSNL